MSQFVLEVSNLNKSFGKKHVLKDVTFNVKPHEIVGFIGPNGAGKSTTMKCICNLIFPDSGVIKVNGHDLSKDREKALASQSALIESPGLYMDMTGRENIKLIAGLRKISKTRIEEIYDFTELRDALDRKASGYSMGMKQRLALGIAIMSKPRFLILDEPSNGLDPTGIIHLRSTLEHLMATEDIAILFSSHQLGEVEKLANRIICINQGRMIEPPSALNEQFSYIFQVSNQAKANALALTCVPKEKIKLIAEDALRVELSNHEQLDEVIGLFQKSKIKLLDVQKDVMDVESIYKEVYGAL
ncbi:ABC transporter ATP-binding protein [Fusibacter tunisiensis]|uniref:ABC-2 type transport system ATP-binding protein n=1 Tax=Fusibacter tunisiensis TaxID=1008308 RepID=A0ABS2MTQ8_9FIRM|nr:ATP-binding cassette domain-containing protein [Fusibacter tunisiensis]MBM7562735.1 ABC-2 type transport system ATP-binding protein [Fusibacter tunisiensis]